MATKIGTSGDKYWPSVCGNTTIRDAFWVSVIHFDYLKINHLCLCMSCLLLALPVFMKSTLVNKFP